jgi:predicted peroxiredoxin
MNGGLISLTQEKERDRKRDEPLFLVVCTSGLNSPATARSALMFATIAATANTRTILYCVQDGVDIVIKGAVDKEPNVKPGMPTLKQRLQEAIEAGIEFQVCSQTFANKGLKEEDLIPEAKITGAATLVTLSLKAEGFLTF